MGIAARKLESVSAPDAALTLLIETIERLSSTRTVEDVAAIVKSAARRISGADGVCFVLRDEGMCHYLDEEAIGPLWKGRRFPLTACISGWVMLHGETAVIPDIYQDVRIPHDAYRPTFVKSLIMTPVRVADPIAAIGAYWGRVRTPPEDEITKLSAIARATATALENARLIASLEQSIERRDGLIRELDHQVKNNLAVIRAIAQQTLRSAVSPEAFNEMFTGRLMALSQAHELVARHSHRDVQLQDLVEQAISSRADPQGDQVSIAGPDIGLNAEAAVNVQLAVYELTDNAARHGALGAPEGRVRVSWEVQDSQLVFSWRESGGRPAAAPERRGFGLRMIQEGLPRSLGGEAETAFSPAGFSLVLTAPLSASISLS